MAYHAKKFDDILKSYSTLFEDRGKENKPDADELELDYDKERRHGKPRAITLISANSRNRRIDQVDFKCPSESYNFLPDPLHIVICICHKDRTIFHLCCKGKLWTWKSGFQISSYRYRSIGEAKEIESKLMKFYSEYFYVPIETIGSSNNLKKFFQRRRSEGLIERVYATRSQVMNYDPLRYLCRQYPSKRQFSFYHINDILRIIPLSDDMNIENFEGVDRAFTMKEVEKLSGVDRSTIKVWIKRYKIPFKIEGNAYQFRYNDLKMIKQLKGKTVKEKTDILLKYKESVILSEK